MTLLRIAARDDGFRAVFCFDLRQAVSVSC